MKKKKIAILTFILVFFNATHPLGRESLRMFTFHLETPSLFEARYSAAINPILGLWAKSDVSDWCQVKELDLNSSTVSAAEQDKNVSQSQLITSVLYVCESLSDSL